MILRAGARDVPQVILKRAGEKMEPWGTPAVSDLITEKMPSCLILKLVS